MKKGMIFFVTLSLLAMTALTGTYSQNAVAVKPGPVKVNQGNSVTLWCQLTEDSQNGLPLPVHWQSPPNFRTRTNDCQTFGPSFIKEKYIMSCAESWYNMTITDVQLEDQGQYRCIHKQKMGIVDLRVLDPCKSVRCHQGRVCQATSKNPGVCVCGPPDLCDGHREQVCGDDGILYSSLCELHRTACIKDKHIGVNHTNNMCNTEVTLSPQQLTIGETVSAVVAPVLVVALITVSITLAVVLRRHQKKGVVQEARFKSEDRMKYKYPDASSVTTGYQSHQDPFLVKSYLADDRFRGRSGSLNVMKGYPADDRFGRSVSTSIPLNEIKRYPAVDRFGRSVSNSIPSNLVVQEASFKSEDSMQNEYADASSVTTEYLTHQDLFSSTLGYGSD